MFSKTSTVFNIKGNYVFLYFTIARGKKNVYFLKDTQKKILCWKLTLQKYCHPKVFSVWDVILTGRNEKTKENGTVLCDVFVFSQKGNLGSKKKRQRLFLFCFSLKFRGNLSFWNVNRNDWNTIMEDVKYWKKKTNFDSFKTTLALKSKEN